MFITLFKSNRFAQLVSVVDVLFVWFVVTPLVVLFWSTAWNIYDLILLPSEPIYSGTISFSFGFCGQMALMYYQDSIKKLLTFEKLNFVNILMVELYGLFMGHTFVCLWHGAWNFVDVTSSDDLGVVIWNIVQNVLTLMFLRAFRNTLVPPFFISSDHEEDQYDMRTLLQKSKANGRFAYFVDCLSTMFVEMMVAFVWHDFWIIHDTNIYPGDPFYSALASLLIGYLLAFICFTVQSYVGILCEKYENEKVFIYDAFAVICLLSGINVWRGIWSFVNYFAGDNKEWNLILNTMAWILLVILNCTLSLSAKDIYKDAEEPGRSCTKFQTQYFSKMLFPAEETEEKSNKTETVTISTRL